MRDEVVGAGDEGCLLLADERMAALRRRGRDRAGDGHQGAAEVAGAAGGGHSAAARGGLDYDSPGGHRSDDAVTGQKAQTAGPPAGRVLADDSPAGGDVSEQAPVLAGVGHVGAAGEDGDGAAVTSEAPW